MEKYLDNRYRIANPDKNTGNASLRIVSSDIFDISGSDWLVVLTFSFSVTSQDSLMFLSESRIERDQKKPGLESILVLARFLVFKPGFS
jgi:hypothetical protein